MVFEILGDLQKNEKKTIIFVEQNAKKRLEFADIGYVLVSGWYLVKLQLLEKATIFLTIQMLVVFS
jgi:ABC-type branched-subunit amino acid transport system ATPase component